MRTLSNRQIAWWSLLWAAAIELVTVVLRFGFQLEASRDTASTEGVLTGGIRIHHGYIGLLLVIVAWALWRRRRPWAQRLLIAGVALFASDMVHHFIVLWWAVGSPEFHLVYPELPAGG